MTPTRDRARTVAFRLVHAVDRVVPARPAVVVHSSPDLDDNVVALLRGGRGRLPAGTRVTVIAEDAAVARRRARALGLSGTSVVARRSLRGAWRYFRSAVAVSTHGLFDYRPRPGAKQVVGLWHGEFGKLIGPFIDEGTRHFDWVPVSSPLSRTMRAAEFGLAPASIHVVGSPRQRLLDADGAPSSELLGGRRAVVWAPTYRRTSSGQVRTDGDPDRLAAEVPLDDPDLLALLRRHDATLWFRPHPAEASAVTGLSEPWVRRATNADLEALGITFYELLAATDAFVTDYSSLWVDFVLRDRPMVAFCPDLDDYRGNRGLALEPHEEWFPGPVVGTRRALLDALDRALEQDLRVDEDAGEGVERRARARRLLHTTATDPVAATWTYVAGRLGAGSGSGDAGGSGDGT